MCLIGTLATQSPQLASSVDVVGPQGTCVQIEARRRGEVMGLWEVLPATCKHSKSRAAPGRASHAIAVQGAYKLCQVIQHRYHA